MNNYFKDKVVIVTGSSRGVGFATAKTLVTLGAKVVLTARGTDRLEKSRKILSSLGEVIAIPGDIGSYEDSKRILEQTLTHFSRIDILINNAGISMRGKFENLHKEVIQNIVGTNLFGSIYLTNLAIPYLKETHGQIIFISSIAGLLGLPNASAYCATKFALKGLSESLRIELDPYGIHVGIVYLGFTEHDPEKRLVSSDGELLLPDRPAHHTQAQAAQLILNMINKRNKSLTMTPIGKLAMVVSRLCPGIVEIIVKAARENNWKIYQKLS
jgi:short-subunit dehydrogenase